MSTLILSAPAKININLRILGRRDDGFHEIDTLMVRLPGLADSLSFRPENAFSFHCTDPSVPSDERNLVVKAVRAFEQATGISAAIRITLEKSVPHGAGLGGGSSDAASTLIALNLLHSDPLTHDEVSSLAATLGSDIPFFLNPGAARCTGRGEIIQPAPFPTALPVLLLKPAFSVATPDAYGRLKDATEIPGIPYGPQTVGDITLVNDLERPVFGKHRFLAEMKRWLLDRPETRAAMMSGSGATVFAVLHHLEDAPALADAAREALDPQLWSYHGLTDSL